MAATRPALRNTTLGIRVDGAGKIVRHKQVLGTGGSTRVVDRPAYGIALQVSGGRILDNDINHTVALDNGLAHGIFLFKADGSVIESNRIDDVATDTGTPYGIHILESNNVLVKGNSITQTDRGIYFLISTGKYRNNLTSGVTTPFTGGTDAGGND